MKITAVTRVCGLILASSLILIAVPVPTHPAEENLQETIDYLLEYVRTSDVAFIRNNKEHTPEQAAEHILKKYNHYKKKIKAPEDFIRLSATKSMMSGKPYQIRTADGVTLTSAQWFTRALKEYRLARAQPPKSAAVELQLNLPCPDSSRYEIRAFERKSGDCEDPYKDCISVKINYPEILETPIVDGEIEINIFILQAILKSPSQKRYIESLEDLAEGFFSEYRDLRQDMPDYTTGWFLERNVTVMYNGPHILSLDLSEIIFTGGAHPSSTRNYVTLDISTGMTLILSDILMDGHAKSLNEIAEREFRQLKQIPPDEDLNEAGFWFEDGKFSVSDNFAITDEGLVFYFNNYEIASYADGPTRLVIPYEDLKPLIRENRLEWFDQDR